MPLYEYKCRDCGVTAEFLVRRDADAAQLRCETCGSDNLERVLSVPAKAQIKGQGGGQMQCGRDAPCCGRDTPCDSPGCND